MSLISAYSSFFSFGGRGGERGKGEDGVKVGAFLRGCALIRINTVNIKCLKVGFKFMVLFFIEFFSISSFKGSTLFNQCDYK